MAEKYYIDRTQDPDWYVLKRELPPPVHLAPRPWEIVASGKLGPLEDMKANLEAGDLHVPPRVEQCHAKDQPKRQVKLIDGTWFEGTYVRERDGIGLQLKDVYASEPPENVCVPVEELVLIPWSSMLYEIIE